MNYPNILNGIPIQTSSMLNEFKPKLELSSNASVTDEFRATFNKWLLDMFGSERLFYMTENGLIMHPNNKHFLIKEIDKGNFNLAPPLKVFDYAEVK